MKGRSISLILCFLLAFVLAGCGGETIPTEETTPAEATAAALDPAIAEALQVSEDMADDLSAGVQDLDLTSEQEHSTLRVIQTFGNTQELYVLLEMTFDETVATPLEENAPTPDTYTLLGQEESGYRNTSRLFQPLSYEGNTMRVLCYFLHSGGPWPEGDLQLTVGDFAYYNDEGESTPANQDTHTLTWTPTNQGTIFTGDIVTTDGSTLGDVTLSPFSLQFSLDDTEKEDFFQVTDTIALLYQDGSTKQVGHHFSGGGSDSPPEYLHGSRTFSPPEDLSQVTGVQIDGHTVTF